MPVHAAAPAANAYVALGDSYTSGPLVPNPTGNPVDCGRSDHNYPALVAAALRVAVFRDVSCGSASSDHFTSPQTGLQLGGTNPPQFNALAADAAIVTVGIGGNDIGLGLAVIDCIRPVPPPVGPPPCADALTAGGVDQMSRDIAKTAPKIDAVLAAIHRRAPAARVIVVGYPHMFPDTGSGCWPYLPFLPEDVVYLRAKLVELNTMLARRTKAARRHVRRSVPLERRPRSVPAARDGVGQRRGRRSPQLRHAPERAADGRYGAIGARRHSGRLAHPAGGSARGPRAASSYGLKSASRSSLPS